jgi:hypothetical protein
MNSYVSSYIQIDTSMDGHVHFIGDKLEPNLKPVDSHDGLKIGFNGRYHMLRY